MRVKLIEDLDSNGNELNASQEAFFKRSKVRNNNGELLVVYRGTVSIPERKQFLGSIKWFTSNKDYAQKYVISDKSMVYSCYLNCVKIFDCGNTDGRLFNLNPAKLSLTKEFNHILSRLNLTEQLFVKIFEDELRDKTSYTWHIYTIVRTDKFADIVRRSGYDCIRTIEEDDNVCWGVLRDNCIKLTSNKTPTNSNDINESLDESVVDDTSNIDMENYVIGKKGIWFAKDKREVDNLTKAYCSDNKGKTWQRCYLERKSDAPSGRTQAGKAFFRTPNTRLGRVSIGRNILTWYANRGIHRVNYGLEIDHKNGDYTNDSLSNLRRLTPSDNLSARTYQQAMREDATPPKKTGKAYKVFRVKNGKLYPPMVANAGGKDTPVGVWLEAEEGEFAGLSKTGRKQVKSTGSGTLSYRPGWHLGDVPRAPQFDRTNKETGEKEFPKDFVWAECDYAMDIDYQPDADEQGYMRTKVDDEGNVITTRSDKYQHSLAGLPRLPKDGYYRYRTNPRPDTVPWVITGKMKVNKLLSDEEVNAILKSKGIEPIHRQGGDKTLQELGL